MKRINHYFIILICLLICAMGSLLMNNEAMAAGATLQDLKVKFPHNAYWNHLAKSGHRYVNYQDQGSCNNPDGYTWQPCYSHSADAPIGKYDCNSFGNAVQCCGFAKKIAYDVYGSTHSSWKQTSLANVKPGDVIHYYGGGADATWGHWAMIIAKSGNTLTFGEAGVNANCRISWGRTLSTSKMSSYVIYSAPYQLPIESKPQLTIRFHANGGVIHASADNKYYLNSDYIYSTSSKSYVETKKSLGEYIDKNYGLYDSATFGIKKEGYTFKGWSTNTSGTPLFGQYDETLKPEDIYPDLSKGNATITLYAIWEPVEPVVTATPVPEVENAMLRAEHVEGNTYKIHISLEDTSFDIFEYVIAFENCEILSYEFTKNDYITKDDGHVCNPFLKKEEKDVALFTFVGSETKNINERIDFCTLEVELKDDADFYLYNNSSNAYIDSLAEENALLTDSLSLVYTEPTATPDNTPVATQDPTIYSSDAKLRYEYVGDKTYKIHISLEDTNFEIFEYALAMDNCEVLSCKFNNKECNEDNSIFNVVEKEGKDVALFIASFVDRMSIDEQEDFCTVEVKLEVDASFSLYNNIDGYLESVEGYEKFLIDTLSVDSTNTTATPENTNTPAQEYTLGDVNDDGKIDAADALLVLKHAAKIETLGERAQLAAEVTKDGKIDASDALDILKVAAKIMDTFK